MLPALAARYRITLENHLVPPPDQAAAPDAQRLAAWSRRDAALLAGTYNLPAAPSEPTDTEDTATTAAMRAGAALRRRLGHYLGATFHFEGEWFWGLDRLHYLEQRLAAEKLDRAPGAPLLAPVRDITLAGPQNAGRGRILNFFLSFRSPYTYLAVPRARALAHHYGSELRLRFVLPMVMRGLPVPLAKRLYILRDAKREADRLGLPFGCVADPVGPGVERGLAVLHHAIQAGTGAAFCESFLRGVFAEGIDAATDKGLYRMAARAGIAPHDVAASLADSSWRAIAEYNRQDLLAAGLWGVPSFRLDDGPALWGQDRLWAIEKMLCETA